MPIDTPHPLYSARIEEWQRCRDSCDGEDAVKTAGEKYLPKLSEQTDKEYDGYKRRATYYEAVGRTIAGFVGAIARKPAKIVAPTKIDPIIKDASADGLSLGELIKRLCEETILQGRSGILVDFDDKKQRAFLSLYVTESIINWWDGGIVLREVIYEPDAKDRFKQQCITQYRELSLVGGVYTVQVWRKQKIANSDTEEWAPFGESIVPTNGGKPLSEIPFFWLTPKGKTNSLERPPLLGLVNLAISHYLTSADLEHGRHFSGLPTLYICTDSIPEGDGWRIGSTSAIVIKDCNAKVGYAEFDGDGLGSLERGLEHKEGQMAALGAAVFGAAQRKGVEAAETARIRVSGENSLLTGVVEAIEESLSAALACAAEWMGAGGADIIIKLNREFIGSYMEPQTLQGLVAAYQSGAYSLSSFLYALQQADLIPPDQDLGEEAVKVATEAAQRAAEETALAIQVKSASGNTAAV